MTITQQRPSPTGGVAEASRPAGAKPGIDWAALRGAFGRFRSRRPTLARRLGQGCLVVAALLLLALLGLGVLPTVTKGNIVAVTSSSMEPELTQGDLVINKGIAADKACDALNPGDVLTYLRTGDGLITHRVTGIAEGDFGDDTKCRIMTQGDANSQPDTPVSPAQVRGVMAYQVHLLGWLWQGLSPIGFFVLVLLLAIVVALLGWRLLHTPAEIHWFDGETAAMAPRPTPKKPREKRGRTEKRLPQLRGPRAQSPAVTTAAGQGPFPLEPLVPARMPAPEPAPTTVAVAAPGAQPELGAVPYEDVLRGTSATPGTTQTVPNFMPIADVQRVETPGTGAPQLATDAAPPSPPQTHDETLLAAAATLGVQTAESQTALQSPSEATVVSPDAGAAADATGKPAPALMSAGLGPAAIDPAAPGQAPLDPAVLLAAARDANVGLTAVPPTAAAPFTAGGQVAAAEPAAWQQEIGGGREQRHLLAEREQVLSDRERNLAVRESQIEEIEGSLARERATFETDRRLGEQQLAKLRTDTEMQLRQAQQSFEQQRAQVQQALEDRAALVQQAEERVVAQQEARELELRSWQQHLLAEHQRLREMEERLQAQRAELREGTAPTWPAQASAPALAQSQLPSPNSAQINDRFAELSSMLAPSTLSTSGPASLPQTNQPSTSALGALPEAAQPQADSMTQPASAAETELSERLSALLRSADSFGGVTSSRW